MLAHALMRRRPSSGRARSDEGSAMIITMMVMLLVGALATSVALVAVRNLHSASLARSAGIAVDAANAGISEGVSYLRTNGVAKVQGCPAPTSTEPAASGFSAFDLGSQTCVTGLGDDDVTPVSDQPYTVLIAVVTDYLAGSGATYRIVSRGTGPDRAARLVSAEVEAQGAAAAEGGLQGNMVAIGGQSPIVGQSIFAKGCVYKRGNLTITGTDAYGLPAAVHTEGIITDDQGSSQTCPNPKKPIHPPACNTSDGGALKYDQDALGGPLPETSPCRPADSGDYYANGSRLAPGDLEKVYGIRFPPLSPEDIERLRATAKAQGNLRSSGGTVTPNGKQAVLFYQMSGGSVDLSQVQGFSYDAADYAGDTCPDRSLVVIIEGADMIWNTNSAPPIVASVFVISPGKKYDAKGGGVVGSVYADSIFLTGATTIDATAQDCSNSNPSPSTVTFSVTSYRELDG